MNRGRVWNGKKAQKAEVYRGREGCRGKEKEGQEGWGASLVVLGGRDRAPPRPV